MLEAIREEERQRSRSLAPKHEAEPSGRGGPGLLAFARSDLAGRSPQYEGQILKASKVFRRVTRFAGTWTGGPRMESIRKRVVKDINTDEILLDETIDQPDSETNWVRPLPCVDGTRRTRDIEVIRWYLDCGTSRLNPGLPDPDPTALMPRPTAEEV